MLFNHGTLRHLLTAATFVLSTTTAQAEILEGISADEGAVNEALLFETNVSQARQDLVRLEGVLADEDAAYGFVTQKFHAASKQTILAQIKTSASRLDSEGTLFLYMAGHGSQNGYLSTPGGMMNFADIESAIREVREEPFRRLVVVVFSCYSGNWVDGRYPVDIRERAAFDDTWLDEFMTPGADFREATPLFREFLVMASSNRNELSWFSGGGSFFSMEFAEAFALMKGTRGPEGTLGEFLDMVTDETDARTSRPVWRAQPAALIEEGLL